MRPRKHVTKGKMGSGYRYYYDPEEMFRRTDWFAYSGDSYGVRNPAAKSYFKGATDFDKPNWFGELMSVENGAEIMFLGGVDMSMVRAFPVVGRIQNQLIDEFTKLGINQINGIPLNEFFYAVESVVG
jgi:hypothetical protein